MIALFAAAALVVTSSGASARAAGPADPVLAFADDLLVRGEPYRAIGEYERFLFACGGCDRAGYARLRVAEAKLQLGDAASAIDDLRAIGFDAAHPADARAARRELGDAYERAHLDAMASDALRAYVADFPDDPGAPEMARRALRDALRAHDREKAQSASIVAPRSIVDPGALASALSVDRAPHRSPALAAALSVVLPGAGQVYAHHVRDGVTSFFINGLFVSSTIIAAQHKQYGLAGVLGGMEVFWYGGNVVGAMNAAKRYDEAAENQRWEDLERKFVPAASVSMAVPF